MYESEWQHTYFIVYALYMHAYTNNCACLKYSRMHSKIVHVSTLKFNVYNKRQYMQRHACIGKRMYACKRVYLNTQELECARAQLSCTQELEYARARIFFDSSTKFFESLTKK